MRTVGTCGSSECTTISTTRSSSCETMRRQVQYSKQKRSLSIDNKYGNTGSTRIGLRLTSDESSCNACDADRLHARARERSVRLAAAVVDDDDDTIVV
jgi:hypothetical protein